MAGADWHLILRRHAARALSGEHRAPILALDVREVAAAVNQLMAGCAGPVSSFENPAHSWPSPPAWSRCMRNLTSSLQARAQRERIIAAAPGAVACWDGYWSAAEAAMTVRTAPAVPGRAIIFAAQAAIVALDGRALHRGALIVREPAAVRRLAGVHAILWRSARPFPASSSCPRNIAPILTALGSGLTDGSAAQQLRLSERTFSRRVAGLLGELEVRTRFEAAAAAAACGWLTLPDNKFGGVMADTRASIAEAPAPRGVLDESRSDSVERRRGTASD